MRLIVLMKSSSVVVASEVYIKNRPTCSVIVVVGEFSDLYIALVTGVRGIVQ
jgi:hypothetical protein